jgi:ParB family transcriptional regulator, chromosome partitioning protein
MMKKRERTGLGRGLSALMADIEVPPSTGPSSDVGEPAGRGLRRIPIDQLIPNPDQPRRYFSEGALAELAASIREKGVIQPLIVRPDPKGTESFQIVAGERRWRAAQQAQLHELPVIIRDFDEIEVLEVAIIENVQRADLNPMEEALGYRQLIDRFGHTQDKVAQALGKSRSHIANTMRLLALPEEIQDYVRGGQLSAGHARAVLTAGDPKLLARQAIAHGWTVREIEKQARGIRQRETSRAKPRVGDKDADTVALERDLTAAIGMSVKIDHHPNGDGRLSIRYRDLAGLDTLIRLLSRG